MATLTLSSTSSSVTATVGGLQTNFSRPRKYVWTFSVQDGGSTTVVETRTTRDTVGVSSHSTTFYGLKANTRYYVYVALYDTQYSQSLITDFAANIWTDPPDVDPWEWWSNISSGADIMISAAEWNAFCSFVNEVRVARGVSKYGDFVTVYSGDDISAAIFNHGTKAVAGAAGSGTNGYTTAMSCQVQPGDDIAASLFLTLRDVANSLI